MSFLLLSDFVVNVVTYTRYIVLGLAFLSALIIIIAILFQNNSSNGADSITGASYMQDSYYSKHKGSTIDEKLNKVTKWCGLVVAVCIVLYYLTFIILSTPSV